MELLNNIFTVIYDGLELFLEIFFFPAQCFWDGLKAIFRYVWCFIKSLFVDKEWREIDEQVRLILKVFTYGNLEFIDIPIFTNFSIIKLSFVFFFLLINNNDLKKFVGNVNSPLIYNLNFGPQHPAAHGVLRLILTLEGEKVLRADPHIGLLHRGTEKLLEYKTVRQSIPYFDRLDYVSIISNEHVFCLGVEKFLGLRVSESRQYSRILFLELTRLLNHIIAVTTHAMDVGRLTPFLWVFEEREKLIELYEKVSGARIHANWIRPGGVSTILTSSLFDKIMCFIYGFSSRLDELEELLTNNRIWRNRTQFVGNLMFSEALSYGCSGVLLRSTGCSFDLRKIFSYEQYSKVPFFVPIGKNGDCYDRFILRVYERRESVRIVSFCVNKLQKIDLSTSLFDTHFDRFKIKSDIEGLINHFKNSVTSYVFPYGEVCAFREAPKGEFIVFLSSNNGNRLYRVAIKAPGLSHLFSTNVLVTNHYLADLVTIIGTEDVVFGEIDR